MSETIVLWRDFDSTRTCAAPHDPQRGRHGLSQLVAGWQYQVYVIRSFGNCQRAVGEAQDTPPASWPPGPSNRVGFWYHGRLGLDLPAGVVWWGAKEE